MNKKLLLLLLLSTTLTTHTTHAMWKKPLAAGLGLCTAGTLYDHHRARHLDFVDLSIPRQPRLLEEASDDVRLLSDMASHSPTKNQLLLDDLHSNGPLFLAAGGMSEDYLRVANAALLSYFWVFSTTMRKKLLNLITHMTADEEFHAKSHTTLVHGTTQGGSIMLRTIFNEVFTGMPAENTFALRDAATMHELSSYTDVHQYYDEQWLQAPRIKETFHNPAGCQSETGGKALCSIKDQHNTICFQQILAFSALAAGRDMALKNQARNSLQDHAQRLTS